MTPCDATFFSSFACPPLSSQRLLEHIRWLQLDDATAHMLAQSHQQLVTSPAMVQALNQACREIQQQQPVQSQPSPACPLLHAYVFFQLLPAARAIHARRGIDESISRATLAAIGPWLTDHQKRHGVWGFDLLEWSIHFLAGRIYELGRLKFEITRLPAYCLLPPSDPGAVDLQTDDPVLAVHIPPGGRLDHDSCDQAFEQAKRFFPRYFPDHPAKAFVCISWMMDRQLADYLPADSNLIRFLNRFRPMSVRQADDREICKWVFGGPVSDPARVTPTTSLQRLVLAHMQQGKSWKTAAGYQIILPC